MIHHQSVPFGNPFPPLVDVPTMRESASHPISMLAYRSRAVCAQSQHALDRILAGAQARNRIEGLTGLLIYDDGQFFQWLEGPRAALMRVWDSIRRDPRHRDIELLREQTLPKRFFGSWDMRLARHHRGDAQRVLTAAAAPQELLRRLRLKPTVLVETVWDQVFADFVLPQLRLSHPGAMRSCGRPLSLAPSGAADGSATKWHADPDTGADLARLLLAVGSTDTTRFLDELVADGAALEPLFHEVFEPAARCLGRWSDEDLCDELAVTAALGRLQIEAHRLSVSLNRAEPPLQRERSVLVAPQPGESHFLGASLSSELFWRDGWNVSCEFPTTDRALGELVHENWFDVLELSSSDAHCRDRQLQAMRLSIRTAHAASKNPALAIIVDGRSFHERPLAYLDVGADCGCATSIDAVPAAQRLLAALASGKHPHQAAARSTPAAVESRSERQFLATVF
jgi:Sensors of blue-light using FAD